MSTVLNVQVLNVQVLNVQVLNVQMLNVQRLNVPEPIQQGHLITLDILFTS